MSRPGIYRLAKTVYLGSDTSLIFGNGVRIQKEDEAGPCTHVFLNKGALTRTWDQNIVIDGLHLVINGVSVRDYQIYGLMGHLAFFYVKDLLIRRFRCYDLLAAQFTIHICTFEDLVIDDVIIQGEKDGIHLGRGKRFTIRNGVFKTFDDAVALNAHDWTVANPELGWLEEGLVENCWDLDAEATTGYFCRILAGAWKDWFSGMEVRRCDSVVSEGRLYRVDSEPDGTVFQSDTRPTHGEGLEVIDGIPWRMMQREAVYSAGVRNVTFRNIFLQKSRIGFSFHFCDNRWSRSYYPEAKPPLQESFFFEGIRCQQPDPLEWIQVRTPVNAITVSHSEIGDHPLFFRKNTPIQDFGPTALTWIGCRYNGESLEDLVVNEVQGKTIKMQEWACSRFDH
mgnify:CR=1 FL=1